MFLHMLTLSSLACFILLQVVAAAIRFEMQIRDFDPSWINRVFAKAGIPALGARLLILWFVNLC